MEKIDDVKAYLKEHENKQLLRFITCGNVDDGKSTLIGRLLHDSKMIFESCSNLPIGPEDIIKEEMVRFRTLGCYPLTGAVNSTATTLEEIIEEMLLSKTSERQGRVIDNDSAGSMEKKKIEGYF